MLADQLVNSLLKFLSHHHKDSAEHCLRVSRISVRLALGMKLSGSELHIVDLAHGAALHDLGKIGVPISILDKPGPLGPAEKLIMQQHPLHGAALIGAWQELEGCMPIIRHHHERWDGQGYPTNQRGQQIPLGARIVCIADAYDAMVSDRPYSKGMSHGEAMERIAIAAGTQFDPALVQSFRSLSKEELQQ